MILLFYFLFIGFISFVFTISTSFHLMFFVSKQTVHQEDTDAPLLALFTIDACLVVFFMAVHSGLASDPYRNLMERTGMGPLTRSFYVLLSALTLKVGLMKWVVAQDGVSDGGKWKNLEKTNNFGHIMLLLDSNYVGAYNWHHKKSVVRVPASMIFGFWSCAHIFVSLVNGKTFWISLLGFSINIINIVKFVMSYWEPIPELSLWLMDTRQSPLLGLFFTIVHAVIWSILVLECLMLEPLHLLGIKQVWYYVTGQYPHSDYMPTKLKQLLYHMPHAGVGGFTLLLWLHPCMTLDRLIMATIWTPYIWMGQYTTQADYVYMQSQVTTESYTTTTRRVGHKHQ